MLKTTDKIIGSKSSLHPFEEYVNPYWANLFKQFKLDKRFVRGEGCKLWDENGECYLDFLVVAGAVPLGHNHPEIWKAIYDVADSMTPNFVQPSLLDAAGELAQRLIELAPSNLKYVTFTNSGAESVEAGIKLARAATGRLKILSTYNSFHGETLGALSATGKTYYQEPFGAPVEGFEHIPYGDLAALKSKLDKQGNEFAAFILEPIQGEGGIIEPPSGYLFEAHELCTRYGIKLIVDEIQAGLGRTGYLFACEREQIQPDILLLAKPLSGGLIPIGAVLSTEECYVEDFGLKYTSTFAGNTLACRVGLKTLELLTRDNKALLKNVADNGAYLKTSLQSLQREYPEILTDVRGQGYMLGLEFTNEKTAFEPESELGAIAEQEKLTYFIAGYLLNREKIRLYPTLSSSRVLRLEPALIADRSMCDQVIAAFRRVLVYLQAGNTAELMI